MRGFEISCSVTPSFDEDNERTIRIGWVERRKQFCVDVRHGSRSRRRWIDRDPRIEQIVAATGALELPLLADGMEILDGTAYTFTLGGSASVEFKWAEEVPLAWLPLVPIIQQMELLAEEVMR